MTVLPVLESFPPDNQSEATSIQVLKLISEAKAEPRLKTSEVAMLENQIRQLREELAQAKREIVRYESLLQNARLRELELRAQLTQRK